MGAKPVFHFAVETTGFSHHGLMVIPEFCPADFLLPQPSIHFLHRPDGFRARHRCCGAFLRIGNWADPRVTPVASEDCGYLLLVAVGLVVGGSCHHQGVSSSRCLGYKQRNRSVHGSAKLTIAAVAEPLCYWFVPERRHLAQWPRLERENGRSRELRGIFCG